MKIIELRAENFKKLKAVELKFDENNNLILVTGKNGAGKSSVIDSIWCALGGKKVSPKKPIRDGEEKAEIEVTLKSEKGEYIVNKVFTGKNEYLKITNSEGRKYSNPQEFLDFVVGNLSFDPLAFARLEEKKQVTELSKIVGLDFSEDEKNKKELTQERLLIGRERDNLPTITKEVYDVSLKLVEEGEISITNETENFNRETIIHNNFVESRQRIKDYQSSIAANDKRIAELKAENADYEILVTKLVYVDDTKEDLNNWNQKIKSIEEKNKMYLSAKDMVEKYVSKFNKQEEYDKLTAKIKEVDENKNKKLAEAKMPIEGLSWNEDGVFYNNIPFSQISSAEQLKISMAIAMAANPKLKVILIKDGSLLDQENLKVIKEMVEEKEFSVFVEKVDETGKIGVYIEDGEIKEIN
jgi:energy-coupling factor transporter ATP-binding protein EcfA2